MKKKGEAQVGDSQQHQIIGPKTAALDERGTREKTLWMVITAASTNHPLSLKQQKGK